MAGAKRKSVKRKDPKVIKKKKKVKKKLLLENKKPKARKAPFQILSKSEAVRKWLKMLIYGPYGHGKTWFAGTASEVKDMQDVLMIDIESGRATINSKIRSGKIDVVAVTDFSGFARVIEFLHVHCRLREDNDIRGLRKLEAQLTGVSEEDLKSPARLKELIPRPKRYRTLIFDSMNEAQKLCMYMLLGIDIETHKLDQEMEKPDSEWYQSLEMMRLMTRSIRNLRMHTLIVCASNDEQDDKKFRFYQPLLPGKFAKEIQGFVDVVGFLIASEARSKETKKITVRRRLFLQPSEKHNAKDRFIEGNPIHHIDNPSLAKYFKLANQK